MKAKIKFDKNQLKPMLIEHVEKIVFGVLVFVALLLCWSAIGLTPYQGTPDELNKKAADVRSRVASSTPPEKFDDLPPERDLSGMLHNALAVVNPALFPMTEISRPYSDHKVRRQQPVLLTVQDPRATAGFGAIAMSEQPLGLDRLVNGRNPRRAPMGEEGGMMGGGMMSGGMMGGGMEEMMASEGGAAGGMDPSAMMQGMQGMQDMQKMMQGGSGGGGMMEGGMMEGGMMGGMEEMMQQGGGRNSRNRRRRGKPAPKPKAKPVFEVEKPALEEPANAKLEGRYWVTVVGLIPSWDQEAEFQKVFRDATKTYRTDTPEYEYCEVQRAEVVSPGELGEFETLDMDGVVDDMKKWAAVYPAMIDKKYLTPSPEVSEPLPPLVRANHDPSAIRHPKIPLAGEASAEENKAAAAAAADLKDESDESDEDGKGRRHRRSRSRTPRGMGSGMGMGGMTGMNGATVAKEKIEFMLFRFFDFKVEPGKTYKYRVRLALENPNWDKPPQYLQSPDLAKEDYIYTDWSEPTPEVFVPLGSELLAGDANPKDPSAKILVRQFDREKAVTAVHEFELARGATANADEVEVAMATANAANPNTGGSPPEEKEKVAFRTNTTMVDLVGGDKLVGGPTGIKSPGRMLVMRPDGELAMLSEFSDAARYEIEKWKLDESKDAGKSDALGTPGRNEPAGAAPGGGNNPFGDIFNQSESPQKGRRGR